MLLRTSPADDEELRDLRDNGLQGPEMSPRSLELCLVYGRYRDRRHVRLPVGHGGRAINTFLELVRPFQIRGRFVDVYIDISNQMEPVGRSVDLEVGKPFPTEVTREITEVESERGDTCEVEKRVLVERHQDHLLGAVMGLDLEYIREDVVVGDVMCRTGPLLLYPGDGLAKVVSQGQALRWHRQYRRRLVLHLLQMQLDRVPIGSHGTAKARDEALAALVGPGDVSIAGVEEVFLQGGRLSSLTTVLPSDRFAPYES